MICTVRSAFSLAISIHALREESDIQPYQFGHPYTKFLSTLSVRRATDDRRFDGNAFCISIHALREESDECTPESFLGAMIFLSTLSVRRATATAQVASL